MHSVITTPKPNVNNKYPCHVLNENGYYAEKYNYSIYILCSVQARLNTCQDQLCVADNKEEISCDSNFH